MILRWLSAFSSLFFGFNDPIIASSIVEEDYWRNSYQECEEMSRSEFDGGLLIFEEKNNSLRIYDGLYKIALSKEDILWQWNINDVNDKAFVRSFNKTKNDAKQVMFRGELHILLVSSSGDAIALLNFDTKKISYWKNIPGSIHSATVTDENDIVLADSKGYAKLLDPKTGRISSCRQSSPHGAVWDKRNARVWVWGGAGKMIGYKTDGGKLHCDSRLVVSGGPGGGHDLEPLDDHDGTKLLLSAGSNLFFFETDLRVRPRWGLIQRFVGGTGIKGASYNRETGEIVYIRNDRSNGFKFRSDVIRSLDGSNRTLVDKTAAYKIRWFQKNCFSW